MPRVRPLRSPRASAAHPRLEPIIGARDPVSGVDLLALAVLLEAVGKSGRLATVAADLGTSYRTAWTRLVEAESRLGLKLVERTKGHGSRLAAEGVALRDMVAAFEQVAHDRLATPLSELSRQLAALRGAPARPALRLAASHDLVLQQGLADAQIDGITLSFSGSDDALRALASGEADLAGFHRPVDERLETVDLCEPGPAFVIALMRREQGLIVAPGNPKRLHDVTDLARPGVRFVNRQRGAGTRRWLDRLLEENGIESRSIAGYRVEEATHLAVAAAVAAGVADVGFGLRAAAYRFGLDFVPVGVEDYWLAGASALRSDPRVRGLIRDARRLARATSGYRMLRGR